MTAAPPVYSGSTVEWANAGAASLPRPVSTDGPGPNSQALHARVSRHQGAIYTSMVRNYPVAFESGTGVVLRDVDGNEFIDFSSGIVVTNLGHAHPRIAAAIARQASSLTNVHDFATPIKAQALEALASVTPPGMTLFAFFCAGTEAVEAAMRVARAKTGRQGFVSFYGDYHGRTTSAAGVSGTQASNGMRPAGSLLVPNGHCYRCSFEMTYPDCRLRCVSFINEAVAFNQADEVAGVVIEVITNGAGATVRQPGYLRALADLCARNGMLLIAEEVASGMGRTGAWWAVDHEGVVPDVLTIGKGLGNGFPVTAIAVREEHAEALGRSFPSSSYGGNPMACAAVVETITIMREEHLVEHCRDLGEFALERLKALQGRHPIVGDVRGQGALLAVELVKDRRTKEPFPEAGTQVTRTAYRNGLWTNTGGHILKLAPPIVMSKEVFAKGLEVLEAAIDEVEREFGYA